MSIENLIDALASNDKSGAEEAFNAEMNTRRSEALDAKRADIGQSIYGGQESEE